MKKICITGANGFIGNAICQTFINTNIKVRAFIRNHKEKIKANNIEYIKIDRDFTKVKWEDFLNGYDCVIHCAGSVPSFKKNKSFETYKAINIEGTTSIAEQSAKANVKRFIFLSSINVLGSNTNNKRPFFYDDNPKPITDYGKSKLEAEIKLKTISKNTGLEIVIIRPPIVYGPEASGNLKRLSNLVKSGIPLPFSKIENKRSLIGISNLVEVIKSCIENPNASGKVFLVSDGEDLSTPQLINYIAKSMGINPKLFPLPNGLLKLLSKIINKKEEMDRLLGSLQVDITYTSKVLNWTPSVSVSQEIKKMIQNDN